MRLEWHRTCCEDNGSESNGVEVLARAALMCNAAMFPSETEKLQSQPTRPYSCTAQKFYFDTSLPSDEISVTTVGIGGGESDSMLNVLA